MISGSAWRWAALIIFATVLGAGGGWVSHRPLWSTAMICENNRLDDPRPRDANNCYLDER